LLGIASKLGYLLLISILNIIVTPALESTFIQEDPRETPYPILGREDRRWEVKEVRMVR